MDELKLKLSTRIMRGIVSKLITKLISKKIGYNINIQFREIEVNTEEDRIRVHADLDADMSNEDFVNLLKSIGLD